MDGAHIADGSAEAPVVGTSSSAAAASSYGSASRRSRLNKGVHLCLRWRWIAARGVGDNKGASSDGAVEDLALPLGMSFTAVLAQVLNKCGGSEGGLQPDSLSKIYGDRFKSFMRNFEKSFGSTLRTLHLINETPVSQQDIPQCFYRDVDSTSEIKLDGADSLDRIHDVQKNMSLNSMDCQIILHAGVNQQLLHPPHSRSTPEAEQQILSVFERSPNEQNHSNEQLEIGLTMRKLQLKKSQLDLSSYGHMLEKTKISMGLEKASFKKEKFKTQMKDSRHAKLLRKLIDMHLTAVVLMSICFGYGTYTYSYQQITTVTTACAAASRESKLWWMTSSVLAFNSGLLFFRCHLVATTRISFGILMLLLIAWLIFQRSAMTGPNILVTFNVMVLGLVCGSIGRFCVDTLGGDGNIWLIFSEALCTIHLLGNICPSLLHRMLYGPISLTHRTKTLGLPH